MKYRLHIFLLISSLPLILPLRAQDSLKKESPKLQFGGFVNANVIYDSRQVVEVREGFMAFYPKNSYLDKAGRDVNSTSSLNQYSMTTRLNVQATGVEALGARIMAFIEGDFTGASNTENNSLRLRHAYISLRWKSTRILLGQYWHPLDVPEVIPNVASLNTGAPFHSFSRQPQIRIEQRLWKFNLIGVASSQRDYSSPGPLGPSTTYLRNAILPNLHGQLHFAAGESLFGLGVDYKMLVPRLLTDSGLVADEHLDNLAGLACAKISLPGLLYGQKPCMDKIYMIIV